MPSRLTVAASLSALVVASGCYVDRTPPPRYAGDVDGDPSIASLPSADDARPEFTEKMRFGWTLAEESLALEEPTPPPGRSLETLTRWSEGALRDWLARKSRSVEAARLELDAAAEQDHRQRIVAGALVGLLYEDVALTLRALPVPNELESDPEAARIYQEVLDSQAAPFVEHARAAYRACAENAVTPNEMRHWSRYCAARADRLPGAFGGDDLTSGETVVEVLAD